jgi:hypothetical protein
MRNFFILLLFILLLNSQECPKNNYTIQIDAFRYKKSISKDFLKSIEKKGHKYYIIRQNGLYRLLVGCYADKNLALKNLKKTISNTCRHKAYVTKFMHRVKKRRVKVKPKRREVKTIKNDRVMGIITDNYLDLSKCESKDIFSEENGYSKNPY